MAARAGADGGAKPRSIADMLAQPEGVPDDLAEKILDFTGSRLFGARSVRRSVDRILREPLSEAVISGRIGKGETVSAVLRNGRVVWEKQEAAV